MKIPESFLHFVWKSQLFTKDYLQTTDGQTIEIIDPGTWNHDAGPDFEAARLRIGTQEWAGNIEIHYQADEWETHKHHQNPAYQAVILHVVYEPGEQPRPNYRYQIAAPIPVLALKDRIPKQTLLRYEQFLYSQQPIPCYEIFPKNDIQLHQDTLTEMLYRRLLRKSELILQMLAANNGDWEETLYHLLGRAFGFKVNADSFLQLVRSLPLKYIQKHRHNPLQVEALLLGLSGLLEGEWKDDYPKKLQEEYQFLSYKYQLQDKQMYRKQWKWSKVRPGNTPLVRILQLANVLAREQLLFSRMTEAQNPQALYGIFQIQVSDYWHRHSDLDKVGHKKFPQMTTSTQQLLLINTLIPILWAHAKQTNNAIGAQKALDFLSLMPPERNAPLQVWQDLGVSLQNAGDSQAALEWRAMHCQTKACLSCPVGQRLLHF